MPRKSQPKATAKPSKKPAQAAPLPKKPSPKDKAVAVPSDPTHQVVDHRGHCYIVLPQSLRDSLAPKEMDHFRQTLANHVMTVIQRDLAYVHYVDLPFSVHMLDDKLLRDLTS